MPYDPHQQFDIGGSARAGESLGQAIANPSVEAWQRLLGEKKKKDFNDAVLYQFKDKTDSSGNPLVPLDAIARWESLNADKQAGYLSAAGASVKEDMARQSQKRQDDLAAAQANLAQAKAFQAWTGQGPDSTLNLSPQEQAAADKAGMVPLRQSAGSFQYREDPNNPVNMGTAPPVPIMDPRDKTKIIGLQDARGSIKYFPRPTSVEEFQNFMTAQNGAKAPAAAAAPASTPIPATATITVQTPEEAQALPPGTRYKTPDGRTYIR